jgi:peptidoglycan-associated lipoprotein
MKIARSAPRTLFLFLIVSTVILIFAGGCHKKVAIAPPAAPPATPTPPAPTVSLQASPTDIVRGANATLTWSSTNATQLTLNPGPGPVNGQGSLQVSPTNSLTYTITAVGTGGQAEASARVTVSAPAAAMAAPSPSIEELFQAAVKDAFFDYNTAEIRADARASLLKDAEFLNLHGDVRIAIEGHCDERGSEEYNLGLGQRRADAAKKYLVSLGIADDRIQTTSYGKERPFCTEHDEACWQQNRRGHFLLTH